MYRKAKGFTLIELLVVISIVGLLSSIVLSSLNATRAKARDAKRVGDLRAVKTALMLYYDKYRVHPNDVPVGLNPWSDNFNSMAGQLVTEGFLGTVPVPPSGSFGYGYYNYSGTPSIGGLLVTYLETDTGSASGRPESCRPWAPATNWCDQAANNWYCLCNPY